MISIQLDRNTWSIELLILNHLTVYKQMISGTFKNNITHKLFVYKWYILNGYV